MTQKKTMTKSLQEIVDDINYPNEDDMLVKNCPAQNNEDWRREMIAEKTKEPDPSELLKEAVSLLGELYGAVAGGLSAPECHDLIRQKAENARKFLTKQSGRV